MMWGDDVEGGSLEPRDGVREELGRKRIVAPSTTTSQQQPLLLAGQPTPSAIHVVSYPPTLTLPPLSCHSLHPSAAASSLRPKRILISTESSPCRPLRD